MTLDDLDLLKDVDDPRVSPDGKWVAYTVEADDKESDSGIADLWMVSWDGSQDIRLTWNYDASVTEPRWSPDGRYLSFLSDREGAPKVEGAQVWLLDRRGGEAHQLTAIKDKLDAYEWSPDSKKLLLTITEIPEAKKEKDKDKKPRERSLTTTKMRTSPSPSSSTAITSSRMSKDISRPTAVRRCSISTTSRVRNSTKLPPTRSSMSRRRRGPPTAARSSMSATTTPTPTAAPTPMSSSSRRGQIPSHGN